MRLRSAFTIPEALTGLVIVGVMFTSLYGGISFSVASTRIARENLRAAQILTEKMEVVRLCTWEQINSNGFLPAKFTAPYEPGGPTNGSALVYKGTIKVRPPPSGFLPDQYTNAMRLIDVTVSWNSGGVDRDRETHTFVSAYGLQNYIIKPK
jgi:type II secretory pathway pseudopilin PulG